jgi:hypothetical protein
MKSGLSVPVQHPPDEPGAERISELLEQVKLARELGFDSIPAIQHYLAAPSNTFSRFRSWRVSPSSPGR